MASYTVTHRKSKSFYENYERKAESPHQTHYCPGCGHGNITKLLAQSIGELGIQDRTVLVTPVGCSVFGYYYFDVGNIQAAHGRASAVATAVKRSRPDAVVLAYQGDGDLAAIGTAEIIHAANRGEPITVIFANNGIYGMTGGQMAPTTPLGKKSTTSPFGRSEWTEGYPVKMCEMLNALHAPVFIERVCLGDSKQIMQAGRAIRRALECQVKGLGFAFVEVISPCPTIWKMEPIAAKKYARDEMTAVFPVGNLRDRTKETAPRPAAAPATSIEKLPEIMGLTEEEEGPAARPAKRLDLRIKIAGFGGQGVLLLGEVLAEAGLDAGYEVSWLPSYGPEMRAGTSNCHVRIGSTPVDCPIVSRSNILIALNEPSLRKFINDVEPGGIVLYNDEQLPEGCSRPDVRTVSANFTGIADHLGSAKACNMAMLGALLEADDVLDEKFIAGAIKRRVKTQRWFDLDMAAIAEGRKQVRPGVPA